MNEQQQLTQNDNSLKEIENIKIQNEELKGYNSSLKIRKFEEYYGCYFERL